MLTFFVHNDECLGSVSKLVQRKCFLKIGCWNRSIILRQVKEELDQCLLAVVLTWQNDLALFME